MAEKEKIHDILMNFYAQKGLIPAIQVAEELLKKQVASKTNLSTAELNAVMNGEICETVLEMIITDFMHRNPKRTKGWQFCKSVVLSDLDSADSEFLTEMDALLLTPGCIYIFECKSYTGDKQLLGNGVITRKKGNDCDVFSQNSLHLKILQKWLNKFSKKPRYQMVLFDFSSGSMTDMRDAGAKKLMRLTNKDNVTALLREDKPPVWNVEDLTSIKTQFDRVTTKLRKKQVKYVKSLKH